MTLCLHCGAPMRPGRNASHLKRDCTTAWWKRLYASRGTRGGRPPKAPAKEDISPEAMEAIMRRRAREQRWERAVRT